MYFLLGSVYGGSGGGHGGSGGRGSGQQYVGLPYSSIYEPVEYGHPGGSGQQIGTIFQYS